MHDLIFTIALIGVLGIGAQWVAWRTQVPAIVLLLLAGLLAGPVTGLVNPSEDFGDLLKPLVALAVAIILFEGGMTLTSPKFAAPPKLFAASLSLLRRWFGCLARSPHITSPGYR